jgi:hypothetical protein
MENTELKVQLEAVRLELQRCAAEKEQVQRFFQRDHFPNLQRHKYIQFICIPVALEVW